MSSTDAGPQIEDGLFDRLRSATLGRYDIYAELGRGGMAAVFLALDVALGRKVAIKAMLPEIAVDAGAVERFRREARFAASMGHPNIIPIYTVGESNEPPFIVMKFIDGRSLDSVLHNEGAQSAAFVHAVLQQVGAALDYAHRRDIIHRDVKPANIMLDNEGWILLADFGIAKTSSALALTSSGMIVGTPAYMSPEHFNGSPVGPLADQYALGCVAYELLAGQRPFERKSVGEMMKAHLMDEPRPLMEYASNCPPRLAECIHRMIAKDPVDRFPSLAAAVHALGAVEPEQQRTVATHIVNLAKSGAEQRPRISQPISPVPPSAIRRGPTRTSPQANVADGAAPRSLMERVGIARLLAGVTSAVALSALVVWLWTRSDGSSPAVPSGELPVSPTASQGGASRSSVIADTANAADSAKPGSRVAPRTASPVSPEASPRLAAKKKPSDTGASSTLPPRDTSTPVVTPAPVAVPDTQQRQAASLAVPDSAAITIGSRTPGAYLYLDGAMHSALYGKRLVVVRLAAGRHRIIVSVQDCATPFDTVVTLAAGEKLNLNYKNPTCDFR